MSGAMGSALEDLLKVEIADKGSIGIGRFMELALSHPEYGYYMTRDPFGQGGDFTTAPEVSQLFGEMLGAWAADIWRQMGSPERLVLLECGPGRGTLMADMMRATKGALGFHDAVELHLLEISPILKAKQQEALSVYEPSWHTGLESVPDDTPMIVIGNEFLDALPFHSLQKTTDGWAERVVMYEDSFVFGLRPAEDLEKLVPFHLRGVQAGSVFEASLARNEFMTQISERLKSQGGAALFIDYGHDKSAVGDTFQALKGNAYVDVFSHIGEADLTSHVDFEALVSGIDIQVHGPVRQCDFLRALGIEVRAQMLIERNGAQHEPELKKGLHRLLASSEMGSLFKVIGLSKWHDTSFNVAGF